MPQTRRIAGWACGLLTTVLTASLLTAVPADAVSGGTPAAEGTYGFVARLSNGVGGCTGALIDPQWVITASACFSDNTKPITVTFGTKDVVRHVSTLVPRTDRNVVLAKLDGPVTAIAPVSMASRGGAAGETLRVAGYGRTATDWVPDRPSTATFTVASGDATTLTLTSPTGNDTCKGDAGGPALREAAGTVELAAINSTSWQHGCLAVTETRQGSTDTRVDNIRDWIIQQTTQPAVQFKNHITGRCVLALARNNTNGAPITQFDCNPPYQDQVWDLVPVSNGFQIRNHATGRCLLTQAATSANGAPVVQFDCNPPYEDQVWDLLPVDGGGVQVRNHITGRCLLAPNRNNTNGAPITQFDCNPPYQDQVWDLIPAS